MEIKIPLVPAVERSEYETPREIPQRPKMTSIQCWKASQDQGIPDCLPLDKSPSEIRPLDLASVASEESDLSSIVDGGSISHVVTVKETLEVLYQVTPDMGATNSSLEETTSAVEAREEINHARRIWTSPGPQIKIKIMMNVYTTLKGVIFTRKMSTMAVLSEVPVTTEDVKIEDIHLCGTDNQTPEKIGRLRQRIWKFRHLLIGKGNALPPATPEEIERLRQKIRKFRHFLIGKGNALPPAARGVVCDINVGGARPIAHKCRKLRIQFREKLADLIKGLLSAKMINYYRSPWASPIVVMQQEEQSGYQVAHRLSSISTDKPRINDLLEDLESTLWYCSLNMASRFWVVKMTDRARLISVFVTPFGLFEWDRMPFGLKNAPRIYQRTIDNALYGFTRVPKSEDHGSTLDVFEDGESVDPGKPSVLGRRSYIDDILIPANNWDQLCDRVEGLLEACD
ncbi:LOW QUALITY PROTEIN: reverse transcriptase [Phytophthora megakarya]|uniref:Reverse transcriptase n=1 Tax=Phytophthora megakarya TaxID=4795 RepID=A0A225VB81_9STRA|nr:LOW QUALITY PROTEIN: reverse transcriptase [Phytophthora megakarya]